MVYVHVVCTCIASRKALNCKYDTYMYMYEVEGLEIFEE